MDYIFILERSRGTNGRGGSNKFTLKMKRDSFKMLLLSANTQYSKEIYRYLISFENHVKQYVFYQHECELFKKQQEITQNQQQIMRLTEQVQAPPLLNKYQQNRIKNAPVKGYVYVATTKRNEKNDLYKIGYTDILKKRKTGMNSSHVRNDDIIYYAYTVKSYNAKNLETLIHDQLQDFQYKESSENSAKEWYLFPLDSIIRIIDFIVEKYANINEFSEIVKNEVMNSVASVLEQCSNLSVNLQTEKKESDLEKSNPCVIEATEYQKDFIDLIKKFQEHFEITNNETDFVRSKYIIEWLLEHGVNSEYHKLSKLLKKHSTAKNLCNVQNKCKNINGKCVRIWLGIKQIEK